MTTSNQASLSMTKEDFLAWRKHNDFSVSKAARLLGLSRQTIYSYENGESDIPEAVRLACSALQVGIRTWPPEVIVDHAPSGVLAAPFTGPNRQPH